MNSDEKITLETLPGAFAQLLGEVYEIKSLVHKMASVLPPEHDQWLDISELCQYHPDKPTKATVYSWVSTGTIPVHRSSKKLRFLKSEIDSWLKQGRKKTFGEIRAEADAYLRLKAKGGKQ